MNLSQADKAISKFLVDNWVETPIVWENVESKAFFQPGQPLVPYSDTDYIAVRSIGRGSTTLTVPALCTRGAGQLFIASCVKAGTGVRTAKRRLDTLIELMENSVIRGQDGAGTVRFGNYTGPVSYIAPNSWFVEEVAFLYWFERFSEQ